MEIGSYPHFLSFSSSLFQKQSHKFFKVKRFFLHLFLIFIFSLNIKFRFKLIIPRLSRPITSSSFTYRVAGECGGTLGMLCWGLGECRMRNYYTVVSHVTFNLSTQFDKQIFDS
jgi:hypothetical protein